MEPVEEPPRKISKHGSEEGKEKNEAPSKLTTIDASQLEAISQKDKPQPTVTNVFCRPHPVSPFQPASSRAESSCVGSQVSVRGNMHQLPLNGHAFLPPHSCYGHFPPYRGFLSNSFTEYLALDPTLFLRRQKPRTIFSADQLKILEATFKVNSYPSAATRKQVASRVGLPVDRVRVWYQNRRAKEKRLKEDRLALSLLTCSNESSLASTSRLHSELLQQKLRELQSRVRPRASTSSEGEQNSESEEAFVRNLLKEAKARESARTLATVENEGQKCCTVTKPDAEETKRSETESTESQSSAFHFPDESRRTETLATKMYAEHLRILKELAQQSEKNKQEAMDGKN